MRFLLVLFVTLTLSAATCVPVPPFAPAERQDCITLVNKERVKVGVPALTRQVQIETAARKHSEYQASINTMTHRDTVNGDNAGLRMAAEGWFTPNWVEVVAAGQLTCTEVVAAWLAAPTHRPALLNPQMRWVGYGVATSALTGLPYPYNGGVQFWTMDFSA